MIMDTPASNQGSRQSLRDFAQGLGADERFDIEVSIKEDGRVVVFHSHPFREPISWYEFDLATNKLDFILEDGKLRDLGLPLTQSVAKYMQNAHQILTVLMDPKTGKAQEGLYVPLVVHRS